jgi:hypothetical protein
MTEEAKTEAPETATAGAPEAEVEKVEVKTATEADTVQADDTDKAKASPASADEEDADPAGEETDEDDDKPKKRPSRSARLQRRIQAQALEIEELRAAKARDAVVEAKPPNEADFNGDYEAYNRALIAHEVTKSLRAENATRDLETTQARRSELKQALLEDHIERANEFRKTVPDFDEVVAKGLNVPMHDAVLDLLVESSKGPMLAYHLAKKPDLVKEIASLSPVQAAKRLGEIEARLSLPTPKKQTQAPAPVTVLTGGAAAAPDPSKMGMADYIKWRKAEAKAS